MLGIPLQAREIMACLLSQGMSQHQEGNKLCDLRMISISMICWAWVAVCLISRLCPLPYVPGTLRTTAYTAYAKSSQKTHLHAEKRYQVFITSYVEDHIPPGIYAWRPLLPLLYDTQPVDKKSKMASAGVKRSEIWGFYCSEDDHFLSRTRHLSLALQ